MRTLKAAKTIKSLVSDLRSMNREEKSDFYQSKCEYYQGIVELGLVVSSVTTIFFIYSD